MPNSSARPLVSVIMPLYNAERFVSEAIESVLGQTVEGWELFVIDDQSTDRSVDVVRKYCEKDPRITLLQNEKNSGVSVTRNRGIDAARGQYIAFLDSDDVWKPEKLQRQLSLMQEKNADIGYCSYAIIGADGTKAKDDYSVRDRAEFKDILKENYIQCSAMLIRADLVKEIKFRTDFYHEDYILGLDLLRRGCVAVGCTEILLSWRYIESSRSFNKIKSAKNRWLIYRKYLHFSVFKSLYYQTHYMFAGLKKYFI